MLVRSGADSPDDNSFDLRGQNTSVAVDTTGRKTEFARRLATAGYEDFLVLERDTADRVLTDGRLALVDTIEEESPDSITELASALDRDVGAVHRDLDLLVEHGVVTYEADGGRKAPRLKHAHVFVEPVV
jgi:predicted transcriptional regulator